MHAGARTVRRIILGLLLIAIIGAVIFVTTTPTGQLLLHDPHQHAQAVKDWVAAHPLIAPALLIALYIVCGVLALPVWWTQILAGYGFGLVVGIVWCDLGATISAITVAAMSRWLSSGIMDESTRSSTKRLHALSEKLGHNGLLVVITIRVAHFLPFSLSNYALGLTKISFRDIAIGTLLGSIPAIHDLRRPRQRETPAGRLAVRGGDRFIQLTSSRAAGIAISKTGMVQAVWDRVG